MNSSTVQPAVAVAESSPGAIGLTFSKVNPASARAGTRAIKRLVRHRVTRHYLSEAGWTPDPLQATVFADSLAAAQTCARQGFTDVELALHLGAGALDFFSTPLR